METLPSLNQGERELTEELLGEASFLFWDTSLIIDCSGDVYNKREQLIEQILEQAVFEPYSNGQKFAFISAAADKDPLIELAEEYANSLDSGEVVAKVQKLRRECGLDEGVAVGSDAAVDLWDYEDNLSFIVKNHNEYTFEQQKRINKLLSARINFGFSIKLFTDEASKWTREAERGGLIESGRTYLDASFPLSPII